ncbi:RHS repeat-associated protein [Pseudomonas sp. BS3782 TE3695]|uniref:RHS repeat-associated core domain-containing protein n=1 Tax=Pseudomonas sp. BS3782 TE3695 TaxID=3349323 RepID=UPI003D23547A
MLPKRETLLCRYHYDPLDRLVDCTPSAQVSVQRFYLKDRLATEIQGVVQRSIMQHDDQLLAQQQRQSGAVETRLLATDQHRSVLNVLAAVQRNPLAYTPYGHRPPESGLLSLLGFNGERPDPVTGCYLLGNGYRAFNPVLMRFNSPDSWSPFGKGGLNAYAYCAGDPVNQVDPTGHFGNPLKGLMNLLQLRTPRMARADQAYKAVTQTSPGSSSVMKTPAALPTTVAPSSIYSSVGSTNTKGSVSSNYASVQSYSSVGPTPEPPMPLRSPPASSRSISHFSTQNRERLPTGRSPKDTLKWVNNTFIGADPELEAFTQIPRAGAELHTKKRLAVQAAGIRNESEIMKRYDKSYRQTLHINKNGEIFIHYERN